MAVFSTKYPGVRCREHATRKHGIKSDMYFFIRYRLNGKDKEEGVGWASQGMTAQKAYGIVAMLKQNIRFGESPQSLAELREIAEEKRQAQQKAARLEARTSVTLLEFWESDYLPSSGAKTPRTMSFETGMARKWLFPSLGNTPLQSLTPRMVEEIALQAQNAKKAPATVIRILSILSQVWSLAVARGVVTGDSPTKQVKTLRRDNRRVRFLTEDEARRLLQALSRRSLDTHDAALLSLFTGLRAGEIHALKWADMNLDAGTLYIRDPKNTISRHAFITPEIRAMLMRRSAAGVEKQAFIFSTAAGKQRRGVSDTFESTVAELGLNDGVVDTRQKVVFHTLRHTFASWLVQKGTPLYTVAELMGHTTLEMTKRYSHLAPDTIRAAAMGLTGILNSGTS